MTSAEAQFMLEIVNLQLSCALALEEMPSNAAAKIDDARILFMDSP